MQKIRLSFPLLFLFFLLKGYFVNAQEINGVPGTGSTGITVNIEDLQRLSDATPVKKKLFKPNEFENSRRMLNHPGSPGISSYPGNGVSVNDVATTQNIHSNFQAITVSESNSVPPDCMGDVSETQICVAANGRIKFFPKPDICTGPVTTAITGGSSTLATAQFSIDLDAFFNSVRNNNQTTDPQVYYDRLSGRWFVVCINTAQQSNRILIAVSNSSTITSTSSFTFYYFNHDQGASPGSSDYQKFSDFPMLGLDKNALYIGALIFDASTSTYQGSSLYVVKKSSVISGGSLTFTAFRKIGSSGSGIYAPNPAYNDDPDATKGYFIGVDAANYGLLDYVIVNDPGGTPTTITGTLNVPATSGPIDQVAKGSNKPLDAADDRLLNVQMMKNKITGISTIWTAQNIAVPSSGIASTNATGLRNAVRWYELIPGASTVSLKQAGTWYDNATTNPRGFWMGSIAASGQGHALAGATAASADLTPNVIIAGRYNSEPAGELANTVFATTATGTYNIETTDKQRWGDFSQTVVDPVDNMTMWTIQEYANATNSWAERAVQVMAPPPATPTSLSQIVCNDTRTTEVTLTGSTNNNYSGFFDPGDDTGGPGFKRRLQVTSTGNVAISGIKVDNPTQIRFVMNYSAAQLGSQQTLTISNPDCQSVTFDYTLPSNCVGPVTTKPITITPNPASGVINIYFLNTGGEVRILDMQGRLMYKQTVTSAYLQLPAMFAKGVYVVQYINGSSKSSEKLLLL